MNKYRHIANLDEHYECQCLKCKGKFIQSYEFDSYKYCPLCGTIWDGIFDIKNKRYNIKYAYDDDYILDKDGNIVKSKYPRFVLEYVNNAPSTLSKYGFCPTCNKSKLTKFHLYTHCKLNMVISDYQCSTSVYMIKKMNELKNTSLFKSLGGIIRLRLVDDVSNNIVKEIRH